MSKDLRPCGHPLGSSAWCYACAEKEYEALPRRSLSAPAVAQPEPVTPEPLCGWQITAACQAVDSDGDIVSGVWELGHRDEDGNFYAIVTVDTGNYGQPEAAEPLALAILARLATQPPAAPAQVGTSGASAEVLRIAEFDAAVDAELPCVSKVPYNSHEICKWFSSNIRERLAASLSARVVSPVETRAARDVLAERHRQISAEGWAPEHDDEHDDGSLAAAASCYANPLPKYRDPRCTDVLGWPVGWTYKPKGRRTDLVRAGALILAEIERIDRSSGIATPPAAHVGTSGASAEVSRLALKRLSEETACASEYVCSAQVVSTNVAEGILRTALAIMSSPAAKVGTEDADAQATALTYEEIDAAGLGLEYVHDVLRWTACGYVHTPERIASLHTSYRIVDRIINAKAAPQSPEAMAPAAPVAAVGEAVARKLPENARAWTDSESAAFRQGWGLGHKEGLRPYATPQARSPEPLVVSVWIKPTKAGVYWKTDEPGDDSWMLIEIPVHGISQPSQGEKG